MHLNKVESTKDALLRFRSLFPSIRCKERQTRIDRSFQSLFIRRQKEERNF